jgi:hypothetical protein
MTTQDRWLQRRRASLVRRHDIVLGGRKMGIRTPFKGFAVLFRGGGARAVLEWVAQCHGANTGLTAQYCTVAGMAAQGGLAEQRRDMIPRRVRARIHL